MRINIVWAITLRKLASLRKDHRTAVFTVFMPTIMISLFGFAIGGNLADLRVAIVNHDAGELGDRIISELERSHSNSIIVGEFDQLETAREEVRKGQAWGVLHIPSSFSRSIPLRFQSPTSQTGQVNRDAHLSLALDMSDHQIVLTITEAVRASFAEVIESELGHRIEAPIRMADPIYGESESRFLHFLAPGIITLVCFTYSLLLTSIAFVNERHDGTMDRIFAAAARPLEVILGHILAQSTILIVQILIMLFVAFHAFDIPLVGSLTTVIGIGVSLGLCGMCLGIFISSLARSEFQAFQAVISTFFPVLLLSGIIWPVMAVPGWLRWLSWCFPTTWTASALRSVMIRGWGILDFTVSFALLLNAVWAIVFLVVAARNLQSRT